MNAHDYQIAAYRTVPKEFKPITSRRDLMLTNAVFGLAGEPGEFADHIKKHLFHEHPLDQQYLEKELGDILWYAALACTALNISMDAIMEQNIEKLKRRYPEGEGFSAEASINRKE